jgi:uncharacterized glyoxalase superfamily protein PhnB
MTELTPMIAVADVRPASAWYQRLLGCRSDHGGGDFDRLVADGRALLMLHTWETDEHPTLQRPAGRPAAGVLLYATVDDLDAAWERARQLGAEVVAPPHDVPQAHHREFSVRDLDGYVVAVCRPF